MLTFSSLRGIYAKSEPEITCKYSNFGSDPIITFNWHLLPPILFRSSFHYTCRNVYEWFRVGSYSFLMRRWGFLLLWARRGVFSRTFTQLLNRPGLGNKIHVNIRQLQVQSDDNVQSVILTLYEITTALVPKSKIQHCGIHPRIFQLYLLKQHWLNSFHED